MKQPFDPIKLNVTWFGANPAQPGDGFITTTGRKYLILEIRNKVHKCMVLPPDELIEGKWWQLTWNSRKKKS